MIENIKILEHLVEYLQNKIDNEEHKIFYNDLGWDEKTIDCINAINDTIKEIERLNNIIKRLEEFIEKETEIYTLELTEKNTNALSYSLPIKAVYKEIYNVLQELKGDGSNERN